MTLRSGGPAIAGLASTLHVPAGRIVFDRTGLTGFEYTLTYATALAQAREDAPSVFTALQEQRGMRLVPATAPVTVLVIDRIERPTEYWRSPWLAPFMWAACSRQGLAGRWKCDLVASCTSRRK